MYTPGEKVLLKNEYFNITDELDKMRKGSATEVVGYAFVDDIKLEETVLEVIGTDNDGDVAVKMTDEDGTYVGVVYADTLLKIVTAEGK